MDFTVDPRLAADTFYITDLSLVQVLLMNDARVPWLILLPKRLGLTEIYQLAPKDQVALWHEVTLMTKGAQHYFKADKMNVATLGNVVPQLHLHVIARYKSDPIWPKPVWGMGTPVPYEPERSRALIEQLQIVIPTWISK